MSNDNKLIVFPGAEPRVPTSPSPTIEQLLDKVTQLSGTVFLSYSPSGADPYSVSITLRGSSLTFSGRSTAEALTKLGFALAKLTRR